MSKVWFITGASRGLGRAIAEAALAAGDLVVATTRSGQFDSAATEHGDRLLRLSLDVTDPDQYAYDEAVDAAVKHFGRIDVLVNNAGHGMVIFFEETDDVQIREHFETNVFGLMRVTRSVLPVMRRQRSGHIINMSSMAGYVGGAAMYSASKFAVTGFTESLALELGPFGIKATNVGPGYFRTDFLDDSSLKYRAANEIPDYDAGRAQRLAYVAQGNHNQVGDPLALGELLVELANTVAPPVHLIIGADAIEAIEKRERELMNDIDAWREKAIATRHATA